MDIIRKILALRFIKIEERSILEKALKLFQQSSLELEDCYNLVYAKLNHMTQFATFDKQLLKEL